jgi:hypothetical protein
MRGRDVRGLHTQRFKDNPEEKRFAEAFGRLGWRTLDYLLGGSDRDNGPPLDASDRDRMVAATVIQWLGSPVGQGFLRDLGYEKRSTR